MTVEVEMPKDRISITIRREFLEWLDKKVKDVTFASRSHAIEVLIAERMKAENKQTG